MAGLGLGDIGDSCLEVVGQSYTASDMETWRQRMTPRTTTRSTAVGWTPIPKIYVL